MNRELTPTKLWLIRAWLYGPTILGILLFLVDFAIRHKAADIVALALLVPLLYAIRHTEKVDPITHQTAGRVLKLNAPSGVDAFVIPYLYYLYYQSHGWALALLYVAGFWLGLHVGLSGFQYICDSYGRRRLAKVQTT